MRMTQPKVSEYHYDLIVIGGGLAGVCTAIAAARNGVKTAIIQDRPVFGGNSSSEIGVGPNSQTNYNAWTMETGIAEEIFLRDRANNHSSLSDAGRTNSIYDLTLYDLVKKEKSLTAFLNTKVYDVITEASEIEGYTGRITAIKAHQNGSHNNIIFLATHFVDCTGDGEVGYLAKAEYRYGREGRNEYGENLTPQKADEVILGSTISMMARNMGYPVPYTPPEWIQLYKTTEEIGVNREVRLETENNIFQGFWWMEIGYPYNQIDEFDAIRDELLKHVLGVWNYVKNYSPDKELAANYALEWIGSIPGKRESRRLMGDVVVTENDCRGGKLWPDRVCNGGWFLDEHIKAGILNKAEPPELSHIDKNYYNYCLIEPYTIPLRALYSKDIENLWMAGRNISVTHIALCSVRVQCTLSNVGQAVGTAAAYAVKNNLTPRETAMPDGTHIRKIQQLLIKEDINILDMKNEDNKDIAKEAAITVSSEAALDFDQPLYNQYQKLDYAWGQVFPVTNDRVEEIWIYIKNTNNERTNINIELHELSRIWEQDEGKLIISKKLFLEPLFEGWEKIPLNVNVIHGAPYRLAINKVDGVLWAKASVQPVGTLSQYLYISSGGCEKVNTSVNSLKVEEKALPAYSSWNQPSRNSFSFAVKIIPEQMPYGASNINNGVAWPYGMPNLWLSESRRGFPQYVDLDFKEEKMISLLIITFDTGLNSVHPRMPGLWRPSNSASHYRCLCLVEDQWKLVYEERENYLRKRTIPIGKIKTKSIRIEILAVNGSAQDNECVGVYEIRVY